MKRIKNFSTRSVAKFIRLTVFSVRLQNNKEQIMAQKPSLLLPLSFYKQKAKLPWKGAGGSIFNSIRGFWKFLPRNLKLGCSFQRRFPASDRPVIPDCGSTQKGPWQATEDISHCCLKELEQRDKSQFCDPQSQPWLQNTSSCWAAMARAGRVQGTRRRSGETAGDKSSIVLLKPGEDIATAINFRVRK